MAAPVLQSTQTAGTSPSSNGALSVTKPTSLAVGDLMIAYAVTGTNFEPAFPSGFTSLGQLGYLTGVQNTAEVAYKVADSSDAAASDFSFTAGTASISRITGATAGGGIKYAGAVTTNNTTGTFSGLTPSDYGDDTLLMQFWSVQSGSSVNIANYAIATSNPTWTQTYEISPGTESAAVASATRPEVTATGNATANGAGSAGADWTGQMISIPIVFGFTVTENLAMVEAPTFNVGLKVSETTSLTETITNTIGKWLNQVKNSISITNQTKNTATFTNQTKNSASVTNQTKS